MALPLAVDAVVFACDGLLAETESGWSRAEAALFRAYGYEFGAEQKQLLIGKTLASGAAAMAEYFGVPDEAAALAARLADLVWRELKSGAAALAGARELAEMLRRRGVPMAVASNSPRHFVDATLGSAGLADLFDVIVSAEDVRNPKPAPDLYLAACRRLGGDPERSIAFEDSRTGVTSARAAGMYVVGVPSVPGSVLDVPDVFDSLAHPTLTTWAAQCRAGACDDRRRPVTLPR